MNWCLPRTAARAVLVGVTFALAACAEAPPPTAHLPKAPAPGLDVEGLFASVVRVRGLSPIGEVTVERLDDAAFAKKNSELANADAGDPAVVLDFSHRAIYVRRSRETTAVAREQLIQLFDALMLEDHFKLVSSTPDTNDGSKARIGLLYADEQMTEIGVDAARSGVPSSRAIAFAGAAPIDLTRDKDAGVAKHMSAMANQLAGSFLGAIYRTGGFRLVDAVLAHAPTETRALFDAQEYLDGLARASYDAAPLAPGPGETVSAMPAGAVFVAALAMANGADQATARTLGEALRFGRVEAIRNDTREAEVEPGRVVLVFDDDAHADKFRKLATLDVGATDPTTGAPRKAARSLVGSKKNVVVLTWSPSHDVSSKRLDDAIAVAPGPITRDAKPLGNLRIAEPLQHPDEHLTTTQGSDAFTVPALDVVFNAPFSFHPHEAIDHVLADFRAAGAGLVNAAVAEGYEPEAEAAGFLHAASKGGEKAEFVDVPPGDRPPAPWVRRESAFHGSRLLQLSRPICNKHATLVFSAWVTPVSGLAYVADWALKVDLSRVEASDYCRWIAEARTELVFPER